jgi:toxin FitB
VSFILDTCVLSELTRPRPDAGVAAWLADQPDDVKFVSAVSLGEIAYGIAVAPAIRREKLAHWYNRILRPTLGDRVLGFDEATSAVWASLRARHRDAPALDAQIAATALLRGLTVVTCNVRDFNFTGLSVFNPWRG